jgi:hypothetical protein
MFTAGARAEILAGNQNTTAVNGVVENEVFYGIALFVVAPVSEEILTKALFVRCLQKSGRNNLISIDVF